ncbi:hypothetical protein PCL_12043 [Purpureocillium lilacinum]|uniref:Uncharacterized protein n=1 Tax=Purpureocillium lilacinum TaxID=33203 RepID=A0A2U3DPM4_PURLI|nr:hypothetical protein PCL_12043 [Purpureocillium lilacinum]
MATASSAVQIIAEWRGRIVRAGHQHSDPDEGRHAGHVHGVVRFQTLPLADVEPVLRRSRRGLCRLTADYGDGGRCAKLDKQITVAHAVMAHSSGVRYVAAKVDFLTSPGGISCCRVRRFLPFSLLLVVGCYSLCHFLDVVAWRCVHSMQDVMGPQGLILDVQIEFDKPLPRLMVTTRFRGTRMWTQV